MENPSSRVPLSHIDPDRVATMYGELGNKLVSNNLSAYFYTFATRLYPILLSMHTN
jgi:hypothetical protein